MKNNTSSRHWRVLIIIYIGPWQETILMPGVTHLQKSLWTPPPLPPPCKPPFLLPLKDLVLLLTKCMSVYIDRLGDVRWKLCVTDTSGKEHWLPANSSKLFASSLCIRWYSVQLPPLTRLEVLQVFAFLPVFYHRNWTPNENR